jgi:hypothetical protein
MLDYGLRITDYGLRITDYGLRITDYGLRITHKCHFPSIKKPAAAGFVYSLAST